MSDERRSVKTYVPAEQKQRWQRHADDLGMSQSEFVRTMVQAGRRGFTFEDEDSPSEASPEGSNPGGHGLESRIESALSDRPCSWEELVDAVFDDFEDQLEETLESLQDDNRVRYNGRRGGYTLVDE
ncbi:DUF5805 domain-containing protein [Halorubrum tibetense]|uniref:DUF5805 domain-containing protein n=1 Tax=Halorubrum tibetense TaxID=175631 RepID=A0ABD5S6U9_9EURY